MKKSELRQIIREELQQIEEGYLKNNILDFIKKNESSEYPVAIQLRGDNGSTKWMNVSLDDLKKFAKLVKD